MKVQFENEIHVFRGNQNSFCDLVEFIKASFTQIPSHFQIYYVDQDGDNIIISCDEDLKAINVDKKKLKIIINP